MGKNNRAKIIEELTKLIFEYIQEIEKENFNALKNYKKDILNYQYWFGRLSQSQDFKRKVHEIFDKYSKEQ